MPTYKPLTAHAPSAMGMGREAMLGCATRELQPRNRDRVLLRDQHHHNQHHLQLVLLVSHSGKVAEGQVGMRGASPAKSLSIPLDLSIFVYLPVAHAAESGCCLQWKIRECLSAP